MCAMPPAGRFVYRDIASSPDVPISRSGPEQRETYFLFLFFLIKREGETAFIVVTGDVTLSHEAVSATAAHLRCTAKMRKDYGNGNDQ